MDDWEVETECDMGVCDDDEHGKGCDLSCVDDWEVETECEMDVHVCHDAHVEGCDWSTCVIRCFILFKSHTFHDYFHRLTCKVLS